MNGTPGTFRLASARRRREVDADIPVKRRQISSDGDTRTASELEDG
jgi:hypothetical protein